MTELWRNHIQAWRKAAGLTQEQLGARCDPPISKGMLSLYEAGKRRPRQVTLATIAKALDVEPGRLIDVAPDDVVPSEVIDLWSRISSDDRKHALSVLKAYASKDVG